MNVTDVNRRIDSIRKHLGIRDYEAAHAEEDTLLIDALEAIRDGKTDEPEALAAAALVTQSYKHPRWCA